MVAYDFGIKHNILRRLASFGCQIIVVPADYPADKVMQLNPDGVFFSNGPVRTLFQVVCHSTLKWDTSQCPVLVVSSTCLL